MAPSFSERIGITQTQSIQLNSMNDALKNSIWNLFVGHFMPPERLFRCLPLIARNFYKVPIDDLPTYPLITPAIQWLKGKYFKLTWEQAYNFLEFIVENADDLSKGLLPPSQLIEEANSILIREMSGYRFVANTLTPISNDTEVTTIEEAVSTSSRSGLEGVQIHLKTSLELLGKRPEPDYRNSIKEAISAVEAAVKYMSGTSTGGLDYALRKISERAPIHGALRTGLLSLYGYSSNEDGIRHAILDDANVGFDEAKFMVVTCSAFVNFLISKANSASLLPGH